MESVLPTIGSVGNVRSEGPPLVRRAFCIVGLRKDGPGGCARNAANSFASGSRDPALNIVARAMLVRWPVSVPSALRRQSGFRRSPAARDRAARLSRPRPSAERPGRRAAAGMRAGRPDRGRLWCRLVFNRPRAWHDGSKRIAVIRIWSMKRLQPPGLAAHVSSARAGGSCAAAGGSRARSYMHPACQKQMPTR